VIPIILEERCDGCGECVQVCPPGAISIVDQKAVIERKLCEECGECVQACPCDAISLPKTIP
jgi:dihydromethanopterin reductase (acceptor)